MEILVPSGVEIQGVTVNLPNGIDIGPDGSIYFSDTCDIRLTVDFGILEAFKTCFMAGLGGGKLLKFDPNTR